MRLAIIIHDIDNDSLLRFTETKLFFDAHNQRTFFVDDCLVVTNEEQALHCQDQAESVIILKTGYFLTTNFRIRHQDHLGVIAVRDDDPDVIYFDIDTIVSTQKRCKYTQGTKQLYIIENLLKTVIKKDKLVYVDNTEDYLDPGIQSKNFYGLASGWKSYRLMRDIGIDKIDNITIYDVNELQLSHAKSLHANETLPISMQTYKYQCGQYHVPDDLKEFWSAYHRKQVNFELIDLFDTPKFPDGAVIWISNVFMYEPSMFLRGWKACKDAENRLRKTNASCIFITK